MRPSSIWLFALLLPLMASCSSTLGILKKTADATPPAPKEAKAEKSKSESSSSDEEGAFHIVGRGETLSHICDVYGLDLKKVAAINKLERPYKLRVGEAVFLPAAALLDETAEPGETKTARQKDSSKGRTKERSACNVANAIRGRQDPAVPKLKFPVPGGVLTSPFGHRWGVFHRGLDIAANRGTPVLACAPGKVLFTGTRRRFRNYGKVVLLDHGNGVYTTYAHLKRILVKKGRKVRQGQKIALVGNTGKSTGPHLHLEVRVANNLYNPLAYFSSSDLKGMRVAKRFTDSPMGPVQASWRIPELLTAKR